MGRWAGLPAGASVRLAPRLVFLRPYSSHYRNRESLVRRQAAERHLEDGGIYRKRWWAEGDGRWHHLRIVAGGPLRTPLWTCAQLSTLHSDLGHTTWSIWHPTIATISHSA